MAPQPGIARLPDELLHTILAHALDRPLAVFFTTRLKDDTLKRARSVPAARILLVCARWHRVGTPLLFTSLSLRTPAHTRAVAKTLRAKPRLGRAVRQLRLLGGYVRELHAVVRAAPGVAALLVSTHVPLQDAVAGLHRALPALQPRTLWIAGRSQGPRHAKQTAIEALVQSMVAGRWTALESVHLDNMFGGGMYVPTFTIQALASAPALRVVSFDASFVEAARVVPVLERLVKASPTLEKIECRQTSDVLRSTIEKLYSPEFLQRVEFKELDGEACFAEDEYASPYF